MGGKRIPTETSIVVPELDNLPRAGRIDDEGRFIPDRCDDLSRKRSSGAQFHVAVAVHADRRDHYGGRCGFEPSKGRGLADPTLNVPFRDDLAARELAVPADNIGLGTGTGRCRQGEIRNEGHQPGAFHAVRLARFIRAGKGRMASRGDLVRQSCLAHAYCYHEAGLLPVVGNFSPELR